MSSHVTNYSVATDTYQLVYRPEDNFPGMVPEPRDLLEPVPEGMWTAFVSPYAVSPNSAIGLRLELQSGELVELLTHVEPPPSTTDRQYVTFPGRQFTLRVEYYEEGILVYSTSEDMYEWTEVASFSPASPVSRVGPVLRYDSESYSASGMLGEARLLPGIWQSVQEDVWLGQPEAQVAARAAPPQAAVTSTSEPYVHAIVGAQFGDLEFDVGKSVRWITWYVDNVFVLDVNLGTPRYWIVNWTETFPDAGHTVTGINYFWLPTDFRREQWFQYQMCFGVPSDDDWILFLDASEGLGVDNRSLPDDYDFAPFKSFLWREIQRAQDLGESSVVLPYYAFLRSDHITNVTYGTVAPDPEELVPVVMQALSVPYYEPYLGQRRLWNAAVLKDPDFDWALIDAPATPSAEAKLQIVSYAYAHWNLQDIEPPQTSVPPLTEENDDGYRMRQLMSRVRPVPGIPVADTWIPPEQDPAGLPGPWSPADTNNPDPIDPKTGDPLEQPVPTDPSLEGLVTPLYDCVFRINMRDGVWYEEGLSGNIPLKWDDEKEMWVTDYNPEYWNQIGVRSWDGQEFGVKPPPVVTGVVGPYGSGGYGTGTYGGRVAMPYGEAPYGEDPYGGVLP